MPYPYIITNPKNQQNAYEETTVKMVNAFVNWYNSSFDYGDLPETMDLTLERFVGSRIDFDCFELSDMYLSPQDVYLAIKHDLTAQEFCDWYWSGDENYKRPVNIANWKHFKNSKTK